MTQIVMSIPNNEVDFFLMLADRMGWRYNTSMSALDKFVADGPIKADLSEADIINEVSSVRHSR